MYRLDTTDAQASLNRAIDNLRAIDNDLADNLKRVSVRAERLLTWRVQQEGRNTEGWEMESNAKKRIGAYSEMAGEMRQERGLQTDHIDLTFTGEMFADFQTRPDGQGGYGAGFSEPLAAWKAGEVEALFGQVFGLSAEEQDQAVVYMDELTTETIYQHGG